MDTTIQETMPQEVDTLPEVEEAPVVEAEATPVAEATSRTVRGRAGGRGGRPGGPGRGPRQPRERGEFDQVTIDVRRVARVMAGGRRFSFSLVVVIGDKKGRGGVGLGKGGDTALAIEKATRDARKHLFTISRTRTNSIPHAVSAKYASSTVEIIPSNGRGLV